MQIFTFIFLKTRFHLKKEHSSRNKTSEEEKDQRGDVKEAEIRTSFLQEKEEETHQPRSWGGA